MTRRATTTRRRVPAKRKPQPVRSIRRRRGELYEILLDEQPQLVTTQLLSTMFGLTRQGASSAITRLTQQGKLHKIGTGQYSLMAPEQVTTPNGAGRVSFTDIRRALGAAEGDKVVALIKAAMYRPIRVRPDQLESAVAVVNGHPDGKSLLSVGPVLRRFLAEDKAALALFNQWADRVAGTL